MLNHNEISSFIWKVCDDELRGLFKPYEYGDVILTSVVLRRLDCLLEPRKDEVVEFYNQIKGDVDAPSPILKRKMGLPFYNHSKYNLRRLKSDPNSLKINFPKYINGYSDNVFLIRENFQMDKLLKNKKLYSLIDKFIEVDLHPDMVDNHMNEYFEREVKPHLPNAWMARERDSIGHEISYTKYFYQCKPLRSSEEITKDLEELERESKSLLHQIIEE